MALELRRVDGIAGRIVALVRLLGGTASVGQDYLGAVLTVEFLPGQTRKVVNLGWVDDSVVEGKESVNATLEIGTGSAIGSGLIVQEAATVIEVGDDDQSPASNTAPVATGAAPGTVLTVVEGASTQLTIQGYDAENSTLSFLRVTPPTKGVLSGRAPNLVYTANLGAVGTDSFTYKVNDGQLDSALAKVTIAITSLNRSPVAVSQSVTLDEDTPISVSLLATDPDGDPLLFTVLNTPLRGTLSGTHPNLIYTPNPDVSGSDQILFKVSDGRSESDVATVSLSIMPVNDAPVIAKVADQRVTEGQAFDLNLVATDIDQSSQNISYSLVAGPQGLAVSPSGRVTWRPLEEQGSATFTVIVRASDGVSAGERTFQVNVLEVNDDPIWVRPEDVTVRESEPYSVQLRAVDADFPVQPIRYLLLSAPLGATLSEDGVFSWTPSERQGPSTNVVRVAATDGPSDVITSFTIRVQEVNQPPSFVGLNDVRITERSPYSQVLLATDADVPVQRISFRLIDGPTGSGVTNGVFYWVPGSVSRDTAYTVGVAVSDGVASVTNRFSLVVTPSSGSPYFVGLSNAAIPEEKLYQQVLRAGHPQLPEAGLTLRLVSGPIGSSLEGNVFRWTPSEIQGPSTNEVLVSVSDGVTTVTRVFTLLVEEINRVPVFAGLNNVVVPEGATYIQGIRVSDRDVPAQMLNLQLVSGPVGARIVGTNFVWTPSEGQGPDSLLVRISVGDGVDSVTNAFTVMVQEVPTPPSLAGLLPREIPESAPFLWTIPGVDVDLPPQTLSYRLLEGPSGSVLTNGVFAWTPDETRGGSNVLLKIAVSDGDFSVTNSVVLSVLEMNQPPVPTPLGTRRVSEGNWLSFTVKASDEDLPAQRLTYSAVVVPAGMTVSSNGSVAWQPTESQGPSTNVVLIRVTDDGKPALSATNAIEIVVREINVAPVLEAVPHRTLKLPATMTLTLRATDADLPSQALSYRLVSGPIGLTVSPSGLLSWIPTEVQAATTNQVVVSVSDGFASVSTEFLVMVEASPRLLLQVIGGNSVMIQVAGPVGALCRLEQADAAGGTWTSVVGVDDVATQGFNKPVTFTVPGPLKIAQLYRVRVL